MEKPQQVKPRKDKKKNTETGLLMGQNTNIFSQLSASYLTSKANTTQQEEFFVKQTQIIEYHDQNINRLISLLRKKAEVTKVKAVIQLKQQIANMDAESSQEFMPTLSNLYQQIVLNESSKQVYEQFIEIICQTFQKHKKLALKQIQTFYPSMLISVKLNRLVKLLFTGNQEQMLQKAFALSLKKDIKKRFLTISKILLQNQQLHLLNQSNYQRNVSSYTKVIKDMLNLYLVHPSKTELQKDCQLLTQEVSELLFGKTIQEYFKLGGKGKASLIQLYTQLVLIESSENWGLPWKKMTKVVCQHFLDKDPIVQQVLWKHCNKQIILSLRRLAEREQKQDQNALYSQYLPQQQEKFFQSFAVGGNSMYKNLLSFLKQFPLSTIKGDESHKAFIQKLNFSRKTLQKILQQEDQNQTRIQAYFNISSYIINSIDKFENQSIEKLVEKEGQKLGQSKKEKEIRTLIKKLKREIVENLEKKYYSQPPASKNSFTYYVPEIFTKLLNTYDEKLPFSPTFDSKLTFNLYKGLSLNSQHLEAIFSHCNDDSKMLLQYFENWPLSQKQVKLDMSLENEDYQKTSKIFLLSNRKNIANEKIWFSQNWDLRKSTIIYDPRISSKQLELEQIQEQKSGMINLAFSPISKEISLQCYKIPQLDPMRFRFFINTLENEEIQIQNIRFLLPYLKKYLLTRQNINSLLAKYQSKSAQLKSNKWTVGERQVVFIRILTECVVTYLLANKNQLKQITEQFKVYFQTIGQFLKVLNAYKMNRQVESILRNLNQLLICSIYEESLFGTTKKTLLSIFSSVNTKSNNSIASQDKLRKNRLKRTIEFVELILWFLLKRGTTKQSDIMSALMKQNKIWVQAEYKVQPWAMGFAVLQHCQEKSLQKIAKDLVHQAQENMHILSLMLSCDLLLPLQVYSQYKRTYVSLQKAIMKQVISSAHHNVSQQSLIIRKLFQYQYQNSLSTQSQGAKRLINLCLKYYQTFTTEQLNGFKSEIVDPSVNQLLAELASAKPQDINILSKKSLVVHNTLLELPLPQLKEINVTYKSILEALEKQIKDKQNINLQRLLPLTLLVCMFWKTLVGAETLLEWEENKLIDQLITKIVPESNQEKTISSYHSYVMFSLINSLYPTFGMDIIESHFSSVMSVFWSRSENERSDQFYNIKQEERIRYINRIFLDLKEDQTSVVIAKLPVEALQEYQHYEGVLIELQEQQDEQQQSAHETTQKSVHTLFIEYAELLMKITSYFSLGSKMIIPDETVMLKLMQCPFAGLKKTCYVLLKQLYDFCLVPSQIPPIFTSILSYKLTAQADIQEVKTANQIYNFGYGWMALMARRKATETSTENQVKMAQIEAQQVFQQNLQDFIQTNDLSDLFLNNILGLLADKLDYIKYESEYPMSSEELRMIEGLSGMNVEDQTDLTHKMFALACKLLFHYSINFPLYLRDFMDKSKKYKSACERLLRNVISDAIFAQQVTMIQIKEPEWKANGSLQIYVVKKNKEIYAEYQHDVVRIGLRLVMTPTYPLKPIHIEFGQGLKLQGGSQWSLMLQSQLHNRNNTIINGILLWKENIDKKLLGVEECAICFDIVSPSGQLPKKGCKTCKKKFHSNCIMKWFSKSNKSQCPLCKSQFL